HPEARDRGRREWPDSESQATATARLGESGYEPIPAAALRRCGGTARAQREGGREKRGGSGGGAMGDLLCLRGDGPDLPRVRGIDGRNESHESPFQSTGWPPDVKQKIPKAETFSFHGSPVRVDATAWCHWYLHKSR